jgi:hypothetical protein
MCYHDNQEPYVLPLGLNNRKDIIYSFLLGKVTEYNPRLGVHKRGDFNYNLRKPVWDSNAVLGDHNRCLHFTANPDSALALPSYGSHRLAVLPAPQLWDDPKRSLTDRCWHSNGCTPLFCMDCEGVGVDVLGQQDFWRDMNLLPRRSDDFVLRIPRDSVWQGAARR